MTSKKDLYAMLDELKYAELFDELDKLGLNTEAYQKLKKSFILGKTDIDFHDRLKALINFEDKTFVSDEVTNIVSKNKILFLVLFIGLLISLAFYFGREETTGIKGNDNDGNSIQISK